jgi:DNA-binding NtrC family response regulator
MSQRDSTSETESTAVRDPDKAAPKKAPRPGLVELFPGCPDGAPPVFPVRGAMIAGRGSQADLRLADDQVSRRHASVERRADGLQICDLGSRYGTFVNGAPVTTDAVLAPPGSVVRLAETVLLVVDDVTLHADAPHRLKASFLDADHDVVAGPTLFRTWDHATRAASLRHPVLIQGESGSGKETIARLIHAGSSARSPFVAVNVAAIPEALFESELFGHERGAFTGASASTTGAFRDAAGGVLFLDEVGELRLDLQVKLLRAIDQKRVRPVGSRVEHPADTRVVAASHRDLHAEAVAGRFRLDLYHRLAGIVVHVPPLRERRDEILLQARARLRDETPNLVLTARAAERLALGRWPGNARELSHALGLASLRALSANRNKIMAEDLPPLDEATDGQPTLASMQEVMRQAGGNATLAAKSLGVSRSTLYNLFRRLGIDPRELRAG